MSALPMLDYRKRPREGGSDGGLRTNEKAPVNVVSEQHGTYSNVYGIFSIR